MFTIQKNAYEVNKERCESGQYDMIGNKPYRKRTGRKHTKIFPVGILGELDYGVYILLYTHFPKVRKPLII